MLNGLLFRPFSRSPFSIGGGRSDEQRNPRGAPFLTLPKIMFVLPLSHSLLWPCLARGACDTIHALHTMLRSTHLSLSLSLVD